MILNLNLEKKTFIKIIACVFSLFLCMTYWDVAVNLLKNVFNAASPIFVGLITAYLLNILMSFYERHYFKIKSQSKTFIKIRRITCVLAALITLIGIIAVVIWLVIPELISCIKLLVADIPPAIDKLLKNEQITNLLPKDVIDKLTSVNWQKHLADNAKALTSGISDAAGTIVSAVSSVGSGVITFVIGLVFSIYMLLGKEKLQSQCKHLLSVFLPQKVYDGIYHVADILNDSFHRYIVGQCTEAIILGTLCIIGMWIFRLPYAMMIGTLIGFTALIPIAGAYIGATVGAIMIFTVSPMKALFFIIFIIILQQIEGNLIYPKVVGKSIGLPALIVLCAITVGGRLMGIGGMLIGVPIASALYTLLREYMNKKEMSDGRLKIK